MNIPTPFVILTSDLASDSETLNARKRQLLERQLDHRGLKWRKVHGAYEGVPETSYLVPVPDTRTEHEVLVLAWRYSQKTVLRVSNNNLASLYYLAGDDATIPGDVTRVEAVGFWREFDPAKEGNTLPESYTVVRYGDHDAHFTTKVMP